MVRERTAEGLARGAVVSVRGSVVDVRFEAHLPPLHSLFHAVRGRAPSSAHGRFVLRLVAAICLLIALVEPVASAIDKPSDYVGATVCAPCHREIFEHWSQTGHAGILHRPGAIEARDIPLPLGLTAKDISFVVGGFRWKALFLDQQGYLVTSNSSGPGANQFNLRSRHWVDFRPGERVAYDCGRCRTTGCVAEGHQDELPDIVGTWRFEGVQCESSHGPGARHAVSQRREDIVTRPESCPSWHRQKSPGGIPLVGGDFLAPYTEANQLEKSRMRELACTVCHDPHRSGAGARRRECDSCHPKIAKTYKGSLMAKARVGCIDCHMPPGSHAPARPGFPVLDTGSSWREEQVVATRKHEMWQARQNVS